MHIAVLIQKNAAVPFPRKLILKSDQHFQNDFN